MRNFRLMPFDRLVIAMLLGLALAMLLVIAVGDRIGLEVVDVTPSHDSSPAADSVIQITFSQPIQLSQVEDYFRIEPSTNGTLSVEGSTLVFKPTNGFTPDILYQVSIQQGAQSALGRKVLRDFHLHFRPRPISVLYVKDSFTLPRHLMLHPGNGSAPRTLFAPEYGIYDYMPGPDNRPIAVSVQNEAGFADLWLIDTDGSNPRLIVDCQPGVCTTPVWSPDGKRIAYHRFDAQATGMPGPARVWLYDVATGNTAPVYQDNQILTANPRWSQDSTKLALNDTDGDIRILDVTTGEEQLIENGTGEMGSFSPDGLSMVYTRWRTDNFSYRSEMFIVAIASSEAPRRLFEDNVADDQSPIWSPDGKWIVFERYEMDNDQRTGHLMLLDVESGAVIDTGFTSFAPMIPIWSPLSNRLLLRKYDQQSAIWVYDIDSGLVSLLAEQAVEAHWLP